LDENLSLPCYASQTNYISSRCKSPLNSAKSQKNYLNTNEEDDELRAKQRSKNVHTAQRNTNVIVEDFQLPTEACETLSESQPDETCILIAHKLSKNTRDY
jgi:hypothetical protein